MISITKQIPAIISHICHMENSSFDTNCYYYIIYLWKKK